MLKIKSSECRNPEIGLSREWLDTNGIGGYASSTIVGCNTRKYHGLLVPKLESPAGRFVLLSRYAESFSGDPVDIEIGTMQYPGRLYPDGFRYMTGFSLGSTPVFDYRAPRVHLTKRHAMIQGCNAILTQYECSHNPDNVRLTIRPMLAYRDYHTLSRHNTYLRSQIFAAHSGFRIQPYEGMPPLFIQTTGRYAFYPFPLWYRNVEYVQEMERGYAFQEDLFCPGVLDIAFPPGARILLSASTTELFGMDTLWEKELQHRETLLGRTHGTSLEKTLQIAGRQFVSTRANGHRVITAGFPWFEEWGRDAMIALPGLLLQKETLTDYLDVLQAFARNAQNGIVPNILGDRIQDNAYNSADASLWFARAVQCYLKQTEDASVLQGTILNTLDAIFEGFTQNTATPIAMQENGLIRVGSAHTQLTWMDATVGNTPVTPRHGCPVEINALWYNFLCFLAELSNHTSIRSGNAARDLIPQMRESFVHAFWLPQEEYLADVFRDGYRDTRIRPNQILAISLPFSPLSKDMVDRVLDCVDQHLYTPLGLRTLSNRDPRFCPACHGGSELRDSAYHNGTVWPWLIGQYADALLNSSRPRDRIVQRLTEICNAFETHLMRDGLGTISEIFDGNAPDAGRGCISQAWSVAEVLRVARILGQLKKRT